MSGYNLAGLAASGLRVDLGGRRILDGVSLNLDPGRVTVIVGPNGAGKSTLVSALSGLLKPTAGVAALDGRPLAAFAPRERARHLAVLPQTPEIAWPVTVRTLVGLGRTPFTGARGLTATDAAAVDQAMQTTGVTTFADRLVTTLSGGERARVLIARALAGAPEWLVADEPLTGLDPAHQLDAAALFRSLADQGLGVVLTLHDLTLALRLADRVVVLASGAVLADGSPSDALTPAVLRQAFGIEAVIETTAAGPLVDVRRRL